VGKLEGVEVPSHEKALGGGGLNPVACGHHGNAGRKRELGARKKFHLPREEIDKKQRRGDILNP